MSADPAWPLEPAQHRRIQLILGYVASDNDLTTDSVPVHGHLDDALLLELAWPVLPKPSTITAISAATATMSPLAPRRR